jgi:hypothetical protein
MQSDTVFLLCCFLLTVATLCQHRLFVLASANLSAHGACVGWRGFCVRHCSCVRYVCHPSDREAQGLDDDGEVDDALASKEDASA